MAEKIDSMKTIKVKIKKLSKDSVLPTYSKDGDAGMDLVATSKSLDKEGNVVYGTGLAFEIPKGYVGLIFPRSSNAKQQLLLSNSVGVIDSGYRGEVMLKFKSSASSFSLKTLFKLIFNPDANITLINNVKISYYVGERIGQIIILPYPQINFEEAEELSETERGNGGYGSTGK